MPKGNDRQLASHACLDAIMSTKEYGKRCIIGMVVFVMRYFKIWHGFVV